MKRFLLSLTLLLTSAGIAFAQSVTVNKIWLEKDVTLNGKHGKKIYFYLKTDGLKDVPMSAIAYCESRFKEGLVSKRGAAGLMQVMPIVARHFKVPVSQIHHTETNVRLACKLLNESEQRLGFPENISERDRLCIILASYNAGLGHVMDARRLAKADGANPNSWSVVSKYLQLKADPAYYTRSEVKAGRFSGSRETLGFVKLAMSKYDEYCEIAW